SVLCFCRILEILEFHCSKHRCFNCSAQKFEVSKSSKHRCFDSNIDVLAVRQFI
ncbi:hypothetical protein Tsubulata_017964, partial [Turnera subulata]